MFEYSVDLICNVFHITVPLLQNFELIIQPKYG
jgi:hypothetical protein